MINIPRLYVGTMNDALFIIDQPPRPSPVAAAPDLLDALRELLALVQGECPSILDETRGGSSHVALAARAAIAKATGEMT